MAARRGLPRDRYSLRQRPEPGSRRARCEEVACDAHVHGWITRLPVADRARLAAVEASGRRYLRTLLPDTVEYVFPPGQQCFQTHWVDKRQLFIARGHSTTPESWLDEFGSNQQKLAEMQARG